MSLTACLLGIAIALPAHAQRVGLVLRLPNASPVTATELERAVTRAAVKSGATLESDPFESARRQLALDVVRRERLQAFRRARQLTAEGMAAYQSVDPQFAAARLAEARRVAIEVADLAGGAELVAEISVRLGAAKVDVGRLDSARDDFRLAHALDPAVEVSTALFKPSVVDAFEAATSMTRGKVELRIGGSGEALAIDGVPVGAAPLVVSVDAGLHLVTARDHGKRPLAALVAAESGAEFDASLEDDLEVKPVLAGPTQLDIGASADAMKRTLSGLVTFGEFDAVLVLAATWRRGRPALLGEWCSGLPVTCGRTAEIGFEGSDHLAAAAEELWRTASSRTSTVAPGLLGDTRLTSPEGAPGTRVRMVEGAPPFYQSPWLWLGVGGVAVLVTTVVLLTGDDPGALEVDVDRGVFESSVIRW